MNHRVLPISLLWLAMAAPFAASAQDGRAIDGTQWAQLSMRQRVVIRIPRIVPTAPAAPLPPIAWRERKAPKCIPVAVLGGASFTRDGDVDLIVRGGQPMRAKLHDDCPTLRFYSGFYLKPTADGMICAKRDPIRARSGAQCEITRFRALVPRK